MRKCPALSVARRDDFAPRLVGILNFSERLAMVSKGSQDNSATESGKVWSFGGCEFDDSRLELRVAGRAVELELKPLEVLVQLLRHAGETLTKDRLLDAVWPGLMVVDGSLATAVSKLRKAINDEQAEIIVTVSRVGYRLGVPAQWRPSQPLATQSELQLRPGDPIPGRPQWQLVRSLAQPETRGVWLAENPKTHERRVFKFAVQPSRIRNLKREVTVSRFLRESLGVRPDFARLLEWSFETPPYFIEMEYGGTDLAEWAEEQGGLSNIPPEERVRILADAARAVAVAHGVGVLHRDLKPTNVLISPAEPGSASKWQIKVVDFGSAALIEPGRLEEFGITNLGLTQTVDPQTTSRTGTLMYMAPEVYGGKPSTASGDVYALGVMLYQLVAGDLRKPLTAGWESLVEDPLLRDDVAQAACVDPSRRLSSAAELANRLDRLQERHIEREHLERLQGEQLLAQRKAAEARARRPWMVVAALAVIIALVAGARMFWRTGASNAPSRTVAVLLFQNTASDPNIDFLRFALADQVATTLSHMRPLSILPLSESSRFSGTDVDLQKAGRALGVNSVVTGHFLKFGQQLQIGMELADVDSNRILWRDTVDVPSDNLLAMQAQIAASTQGKLAPLLGAALVRNLAPPPKNEEAYALYLRALGESFDPIPNKRALDLLHQSVALDPTYVSSWKAMAQRAYADSRFGGGGDRMMKESDEAAERALALDPDDTDPAAELILHRTERGQLVPAYQQAKILVDRRPDSGNAQHLMSYVLRYAGLLDEAGHRCDIADSLDPKVFGSCSTTFMDAGNYHRALDFIRKDFSSEWSKAHAIEIFVRQGNEQKALQIGPPKVDQWPSYKMLLACVQHKPAAEIHAMAAGVPVDDDPEVAYLVAGHLAYCGEGPAALAMLGHAIDGGYCSYPAIDKDPMFATVRNDAEFLRLRSKAMACRKSFQDASGDRSD